MAQFFIDRPVFAWVIAIVIMLSGALAIRSLPISQYPNVASPSVGVTAIYPGAAAEIVENSVVQIIEQSLTGLDQLQYMSSVSDSSGIAEITLTFDPGTDPDIAQVQVQNKLQSAIPSLPAAVQQQGLTVSKSSSGFLMVLGFVSADGTLDKYDIADYVAANLKEPLSRVDGVGNIRLFGAQYAMRVWLDAEKLASYQLTPGDVVVALRNQNNQIAAGQLGGLPALPGQDLTASIVVQTQLESAAAFREVLLRVGQDGSRVVLGDVADVELGGQDYQFQTEYNRQPAVGLAITLAPGANALNTATAVRERMAEFERFLPLGLQVVYPYDTTPFIKLSIEGVVETLIEAIGLVFLVMLLFLQNVRATLIPTIAVPVVLLGTFAILLATGFSINTLTMFGMVLAIGLLVDDAIVVVENVERVMREEKLSAREATRKSMRQITSALVGIALVLSAVFVPMAFFGGSTGVIYRQFSVTVVSSMLLSVVVALTLTPALCATLLKAEHGDAARGNRFFRWFNRNFARSQDAYQRSVAYLALRAGRVMLIYGLIVVALIFLFGRLPGSFLPQEDQGILFAQMSLPAGSTAERSGEVMNKIEDYFLDQEQDSVESVFSVIGFSFGGRGQNNGLVFVRLKDWSERGDPSQNVQAVSQRAMGFLWSLKEAMVFPFAPPPIPELGTASGFNLQLQDRANRGHEALVDARNQLLGLASQDPRLAGVRPNGQEDGPQFKLDVDYAKAAALGVSVSQVNETLSIAWASRYVNDFLDRGRVKRVYVQAKPEYRMLPDDINHWHARNERGEMVPFSAFTTGRWVYGSPRLERYNGVASVNIMGQGAPGVSSGEAMAAMEEHAQKLAPGFGIEWTGMSLQERQSGAQAPALYAISILIVFLCLAALYESWSVPLAVIMVVPLGVLGAVLFAIARGLANDVYFQVGLLTTIGLSAKNAILIIEFSKTLYDQGKTLIEATTEAVRMRLRPIIMTSMAFTLGVTPLVIATGAGSGGQNAIGTGVFGGILSATLLAIFFVPIFFIVVFKLSERGRRQSV